MPQSAEREQVLVIARDPQTPLSACGGRGGPGVRSSQGAAKRRARARLGIARPADTPLRLRRGAGGEVSRRCREARRGRPGVGLLSKAKRDVTNVETGSTLRALATGLACPYGVHLVGGGLRSPERCLRLGDTRAPSAENHAHLRGKDPKLTRDNETHSPDNEAHSPDNEAHSRVDEPHYLVNNAHSRMNEAHSRVYELHHRANDAHSRVNEAHSRENDALEALSTALGRRIDPTGRAMDPRSSRRLHFHGVQVLNVYFDDLT